MIRKRLEEGRPLTLDEQDENLTELDKRTAPGWNDLVQDVIVKPGTNAPSVEQFRDGLWGFAFDPDNNQEVFANFHLRHDYVPGTMVYPHVHWSVNSTSTGTIRFGVEFTWARRRDSASGQRSYPQTQTIYINVNVTSSSQYTHGVSESVEGAGIPGEGLDVDSIIKCRFFRDAENDTFPDKVFFDTVDIHYQCDVFSTPLRVPPFWGADNPRLPQSSLVSSGWKDIIQPLITGYPESLSNQAPQPFGPDGDTKQYTLAIGDSISLPPFHANHDIKPGGCCYFHVHWSTNGTNTGKVKWRVDVTRAKGHGQQAFGPVQSLYIEQAATGVAWTHMVSESTECIHLTEPDELFLVSLHRIASSADENSDTVFGLLCDIHYESDRDITPFRTPNFYVQE